MKRFSIILATLVFLFICSTSWADIPKLINFQGILDSAGNPLANRTVSVEFKIYDTQVGGALFWSETQSVTTNAGGVFNVLLGSSNPIPEPVFYNTENRYLEIKVGADAPLVPRQKLVSSPYAYTTGIEPGLAEANARFSNFFTLTTTPTDIVTSTITVPTDGWVIVTISGLFSIQIAAPTNDQYAYATISTVSGGSQFGDGGSYTLFGDDNWAGVSAFFFGRWSPFSLTRVYAVSAGSYTYYLTGTKYAPTDAVYMHHPSLTLLFVPRSMGAITGLTAQSQSVTNLPTPKNSPLPGPSVAPGKPKQE